MANPTSVLATRYLRRSWSWLWGTSIIFISKSQSWTLQDRVQLYHPQRTSQTSTSTADTRYKVVQAKGCSGIVSGTCAGIGLIARSIFYISTSALTIQDLGRSWSWLRGMSIISISRARAELFKTESSFTVPSAPPRLPPQPLTPDTKWRKLRAAAALSRERAWALASSPVVSSTSPASAVQKSPPFDSSPSMQPFKPWSVCHASDDPNEFQVRLYPLNQSHQT